MRRVVVLALIVVAGLLSQGAMWYGCAPPEGPKQTTLKKVKENLYVILGGGGNTAVFVTANGVVLVDTKYPGWGPAILEQVRTITDKPIVMLINTHTHGDHVGGNAFFADVRDVIVQERTAAYLKTMSEEIQAGTVPRTFSSRLSVGGGPEQIDLYYFGAGHTDGDAVVVFPALGVLHAGDLFGDRGLPIIDDVHGGSGVAYPETLQKLHDTISGVDTIITGHDTELRSWPELQEFAAFNREFLDWARTQFHDGLSPEAAADRYQKPERFTNNRAPHNRVKTNLEVIFSELASSSGPPRRWWGGIG